MCSLGSVSSAPPCATPRFLFELRADLASVEDQDVAGVFVVVASEVDDDDVDDNDDEDADGDDDDGDNAFAEDFPP